MTFIEELKEKIKPFHEKLYKGIELTTEEEELETLEHTLEAVEPM